MVAAHFTALALTVIAITNASPCPYGKLAEEGQLAPEDAAKFFAARSTGDSVVEGMMEEHTAKQKREFDEQEKYYNHQKRAGILNLGGGLLNGQLLPFTGALQKLDVPTIQPIGVIAVPDAAHPFMYPGKTDVRGMCPTLNTMANHGFINRDGITTFAQAANACQQTLGFGYDTCAFLSGLGLLSGGDLPTGMMSIGGADSRIPNTLGPALGISKHGPFEIDQSISRQDSYFGSQADFEMSRWQQIMEISGRHGGTFGMEMWADERAVTYTQSRDNNPNFDAGAKQFAVSLAERVFIFRAMPNGTNEDLADYQNIAPFFLNETFPDAWFKRGTSYGLDDLGSDIVDMYAMGPTQLGHNEGLNNFVPLGADVASLSPAEVTCFMAQTILSVAPGEFSPAIAKNFNIYEAFINGAMTPLFAKFNCNLTSYAAPGTSADTTGGPNAQAPILLNGVYQTSTPSAAPMEF